MSKLIEGTLKMSFLSIEETSESVLQLNELEFENTVVPISGIMEDEVTQDETTINLFKCTMYVSFITEEGEQLLKTLTTNYLDPYEKEKVYHQIIETIREFNKAVIQTY